MIEELKKIMSKAKLTSEQIEMSNKMTQEFIAALNENAVKSVERNKRWDKIYAIEQSKWPYNMGSKTRDEIPEELHPILDECIRYSQKIARDACQTEELTEAYLKNNPN